MDMAAACGAGPRARAGRGGWGWGGWGWAVPNSAVARRQRQRRRQRRGRWGKECRSTGQTSARAEGAAAGPARHRSGAETARSKGGGEGEEFVTDAGGRRLPAGPCKPSCGRGRAAARGQAQPRAGSASLPGQPAPGLAGRTPRAQGAVAACQLCALCVCLSLWGGRVRALQGQRRRLCGEDIHYLSLGDPRTCLVAAADRVKEGGGLLRALQQQRPARASHRRGDSEELSLHPTTSLPPGLVYCRCR